jgi:aspartate aminotransferase
MPVSDYILKAMENSSWIRKMFEEGTRLKAIHGNENVYDFSLGNPDVDPPMEFTDALGELVRDRTAGAHGYMANAGYADVRKAISAKVSAVHQVSLGPGNIVMTCGAAGGLNVVLKTILNPGDQVIVLRPYFVEYGFYIENHGGQPVFAETNKDFSLNVENIGRAVTDRTKAVIINSPNNPTGKVYTGAELKALSSLLTGIMETKNRAIYLIADEPYREIVYDDIKVPPVLSSYSNSIVVTSYSKSLSIPGERIGYIAVNPSCSDSETLMSGLILSNRILGFVNAPALMQKAVAGLTGISVDINAYRKRRDRLMEGLKAAGYEFAMPEGAFYIFCKSPIADDVAFTKHLIKYNILSVPGVGFGGPGYFRLAYCVPESVITRAIPKFREAIESIKR